MAPAGFSNVTLPKNEIPYGTTPTIYIDNERAENQGYAQDTNNYYVWYTTHFSTHEVSIVFIITSPIVLALTYPLVLAAVIIGAVVAVVVHVWKKKTRA